ncbi:TlpA family protein disulfide reductase [Streptomyces sp. NPDC059650]|uniref:TlpA family protein disulfide reductase n=1 Tax=Streptomyces sp. NPDC059650 TaxID=3346896 RepID=UPI0036BFDCDA
MPVLIAVVALVGTLCTLNLVLTLGVVKRLREHTELLGAVQGDPVSLEVGQEVGEFDTSTVGGEPLVRDLLSGPVLFGFFSPTCEPCKDKLPRFVEYARREPGGRSSVVATVVGDADSASAFVAELGQVARVVVEDPGGAMGTALGIRAFPSVLRADRDAAGRLVVVDDDVALSRPTTLTA